MHFCSACQKQPAQTVVLDLSGGSVTGQKHLCQSCAESLGFVQSNVPIKMSPELLEDLLGAVKGGAGAASRGKRDVACPGCGMTPADFKQKGRLGCARCYDALRQDLVPLLQRVHEATSHRGRIPGGSPAKGPLPQTADKAPSQPATSSKDKARPEQLAELRKKLDDAIRGERYEEAARLRDLVRRAEKGEALP
jgi:protein arginine kinase activator